MANAMLDFDIEIAAADAPAWSWVSAGRWARQRVGLGGGKGLQVLDILSAPTIQLTGRCTGALGYQVGVDRG